MDLTFGRLLGFGLGVLVLWELAAGRWIDPFWFSSPLRIARHLADWTREGSLFRHLIVTLRVARVMGASERQIFLQVLLPAASPWIVAALKVGVPFSLIGAIIGEFMAASGGLGYMIQLDTNQFDTTGSVSGIVVLMVCVMLFNGVLNRLERDVLRWRPRERAAAARELP
jgi:ABC-type nitrate/sulfonate/bicarbonate transport system permease component